MSIIREKIRYIPIPTGTTLFNFLGNTITGVTGLININFGLSAEDGFLGYQQEIDNLTQVVGVDLVNPELDVEERRFKSLNSFLLAPQIKFEFYKVTYQNNFLAAGFTPEDIATQSSNMLNSFFIMDFYDTYDANTQIKIFTTYLTKIGKTPTYIISGYPFGTSQLYYWGIPLWYINAQSSSTVNGYVKFSFYNATDGKIALFYNNANAALTTLEKMYFKAELNLLSKTWKFMTTSILAKQLSTSPTYNQKVNNTVANFNNETQDYPSGNTFNYISGIYYTI